MTMIIHGYDTIQIHRTCVCACAKRLQTSRNHPLIDRIHRDSEREQATDASPSLLFIPPATAITSIARASRWVPTSPPRTTLLPALVPSTSTIRPAATPAPAAEPAVVVVVLVMVRATVVSVAAVLSPRSRRRVAPWIGLWPWVLRRWLRIGWQILCW